ncbi:hypothetical protein JW926_09580 [Candidatus Sumerlaeota bacterium]|nr:hypothetical protein [Candidatus Sumerlaeota bacterium]
MLSLNHEQIKEYLSQSYAKVDGLWFVKIEKQYGFDAALDIDEEVWKIMPKIQARFLKKIGNREKGLDDLLDCLAAKLSIEGYVFSSEFKNKKELIISIRECPWYKIMAESGRAHLSSVIGPRICGSEYAVWAKEFGPGISFSMESHICNANQACILRFFVPD